MPISAITVKSNKGLLNQLTTIVEITVPNTSTKSQYKAIWDTGASGTVITQLIVDNLGLIPTGMSIVHTANGQARQNTYIIDIALNDGILIKDVTVTCATAFSGGCNVLIGMDIISQGDFSITNFKGNTCMSFRKPSLHEIDFCANPNMKANSNPNRGNNMTPPKKKRK
ncbi:MAG: retropepsin-like aspartic protease [Bacteroidota bacterium]